MTVSDVLKKIITTILDHVLWECSLPWGRDRYVGSILWRDLRMHMQRSKESRIWERKELNCWAVTLKAPVKPPRAQAWSFRAVGAGSMRAVLSHLPLPNLDQSLDLIAPEEGHGLGGGSCPWLRTFPGEKHSHLPRRGCGNETIRPCVGHLLPCNKPPLT